MQNKSESSSRKMIFWTLLSALLLTPELTPAAAAFISTLKEEAPNARESESASIEMPNADSPGVHENHFGFFSSTPASKRIEPILSWEPLLTPDAVPKQPVPPTVLPITTNITRALIEGRVLGKKIYRQAIVDGVMAARAASLEAKEYIDLVLLGLPQIRFMPSAIQEDARLSAGFRVLESEILIHVDLFSKKNKDQPLAEILMHELEHAYHRLQHFTLDPTARVEGDYLKPYFPQTAEEEKKYEKLWQALDQNIERLKKVFNKHSKKQGVLNEADQQFFDQSREATSGFAKKQGMQKIWQDPWKNGWHDRVFLTEAIFSKMRQKSGNIKVGGIYNVDSYLSPTIDSFGNFKLVRIQESEGPNKQYLLDFEVQDPIVRFLKHYAALEQKLSTLYSEDVYLFEKSANLRQFMPEAVIKQFAPDLYAYDASSRQVVKRALGTQVKTIGDDRICFAGAVELLIDSLPGKTINAKTVNVETAELYRTIAEYLIKAGKLKEAKNILLQLNKKKLLLPQVNALSGQIAFAQKNYDTAADYFLSALKKKKGVLNDIEGYMLGVCLLKKGRGKEAKYLLQQALDNMKANPEVSDKLVTLCDEQLLLAQKLLAPALEEESRSFKL